MKERARTKVATTSSTTGAKRGSLVVVGTGIRLGAHPTLEAVDAIRRAEVVYYLVTDPATEAWVKRLNPTSESLDDLYIEGKPRTDTYADMASRILAAVRRGCDVCAAFYGHPGVFVDATHRAVEIARREGFLASMQPGISAEACLFAELGVNPGDYGCQSFEATDFLAARRRFDPTSELVLYQVGVLGEPSVRRGAKCRPERLAVLVRELRKHYPAGHPVLIYEATPFPTTGSSVRKTTLQGLMLVQVPPMATLYLPARHQRKLRRAITRWYSEP